VGAGADDEDQGWYCDNADAGTHARHDGDDCDDARRASRGRFVLGIGPSGPQVVEGWHGVAYGKPLLRTREYIEIIRKILERNEPLTYAGEHYQIPFAGPGATGLGKPLKSILHGNPKMKIYTATIAPASIRNSAEVAKMLSSSAARRRR
jgi:Luciferase-like monooxygenase